MVNPGDQNHQGLMAQMLFLIDRKYRLTANESAMLQQYLLDVLSALEQFRSGKNNVAD